MKKFFNTAGPIIIEDHYYIPSKERINWLELLDLIDSKKYFILHAPRQTGKTTALLELMHELNGGDKYRALYINIEAAQAVRNDVESGIDTVCSVFIRSADIYLKRKDLIDYYLDYVKKMNYADRFGAMLAHWSEISDRPVVLFIDEVDALIGDTLISLLRQIRAGYAQRPGSFPQSIILCGVRDVKDYRIHTGNGEIITGGSAFNIKSESLTIGNFTFEETRRLLLQHTETTGQKFSEEIWGDLWEDTIGQPWLVNALAYEMTYKDHEARINSEVVITYEKYREARERLIQSRSTHLDQLADKLKEPRVHRVISAILSGELTQIEAVSDDFQYLADLGLIQRKPMVHISNRIYQEVIPRELTVVTQESMLQELLWYQKNDKSIDMKKLMAAFQQFYRENSEIWLDHFAYREAGPQLLLQAFLQRIINGGGRINREYGLGRRRTDLFIEWPLDETKGFYGPVQRIVIEIKIRRGDLDSQIEEAKKQVSDYADKANADEAHIIIFDRNRESRWEDKIWSRVETYSYETGDSIKDLEDALVKSERSGIRLREIPVWGA
jgi:hypothetical protein